MPKRKFSEHVAGQKVSREELFRRALEHGQTQLFRALKTARGFERQKLGRRQKDARQKGESDEQQARLVAEVAALKDLDFSAVAKFYLRRTLARTPSIAATPDFPEHLQAWAKKPTPFQGVASANVTARMFKSTPVRTAMEDILRNVRSVLGVVRPDETERTLETRQKREAASETQVDNARRTSKVPAQRGPLDNSSAFMDGVTRMTRVDRAIFTDGEGSAHFDQDMDRMASSSGEENPELQHDHSKAGVISGSASDSGGNFFEGNYGRNVLPPKASPSLDGGISSPPAATARKGRATSSAKLSAPPTSTTFLPSLTVGGYISGSDSIPDSSDEEAANIQLRKNRRGQRARRAIWQKKFGAKANHVRKEAEGRDYGWDAKRGAMEAKGLQTRKERRSEMASNGPQKNDVGQEKGKKSDDGKLHPSWEAAKRAKEEKQKASFAGKKIVFD